MEYLKITYEQKSLLRLVKKVLTHYSKYNCFLENDTLKITVLLNFQCSDQFKQDIYLIKTNVGSMIKRLVHKHNIKEVIEIFIECNGYDLSICFQSDTSWINFHQKVLWLFLSVYTKVATIYRQPDIWYGCIRYPHVIVELGNSYSKDESAISNVLSNCLSRIGYNSDVACFDIEFKYEGLIFNCPKHFSKISSLMMQFCNSILFSKAATPILNIYFTNFSNYFNRIGFMDGLKISLESLMKVSCISLFAEEVYCNEASILDCETSSETLHYLINIPDYSRLHLLIFCLKKFKFIHQSARTKFFKKPIINQLSLFMKQYHTCVYEFTPGTKKSVKQQLVESYFEKQIKNKLDDIQDIKNVYFTKDYRP